ncbi:MAG TPA: sigma-70 family RNA polymerase sigma factor [Kofleriaceae bacterium]|nr:sigma-70 family RNA polymerase sigma factor [Kofleriaceae bacterium]
MTVALAPRDPPADVTSELDDVTLRRAQRGDPAACRALVERYQGPVFALLGRLLGGGRRALVEDLAQETFLAVFRQLAGFAPLGPARLSTWILTIASRRAVDELRRRGAAPIAVDDVAAGDRADDALARRQLAQAIDRALAELSPEYRAAFVLRELHGLDYADIARALEIDLGTVKSRLARARAALRTALAEVHDGR